MQKGLTDWSTGVMHNRIGARDCPDAEFDAGVLARELWAGSAQVEVTKLVSKNQTLVSEISHATRHTC